MIPVLFSLFLTITTANGAAINATTRSQTLTPELKIPSLGSLRGSTSQTFFAQRTIYQFLGINYAKPPSKNLRFNPPEKFDAWTGLYNASRMRQRCPQIDLQYYPNLPVDEIDEKEDKEDCLAVNVFTPKIPTNEPESLLPVMFYIHGGSFYLGSAYDFKAEFLLEKDLILVVPQYRLGILGFADLQIDSISGNVGMMDIILALDWVQENIIYFGGDPGRVTIVGQSAGGAAVSSLLISPLVPEGLFSQVIMQSGSVKATWAVANDLVMPTKEIAKLCQCNSIDDQEIADCLRKTPVNDLIKAHQFYNEKTPSTLAQSTASAIVIQKAGTKKFLTQNPSELFKKESFLKVPIMGGFTRDDGSAFISELYFWMEHAPAEYFKRHVTIDALEYVGLGKLPDSVIDFYQNKYFENVNNIKQAIPALIDLFGAFLLKAPTIGVVRQMSKFKPSYLYSFNYAGNVSKLGASEPTWDETYPFPRGVAHSDELGYLFPMANHDYTQEELKMVKTMVDLWSSFIIKGQPSSSTSVPIWEPMNGEFGPYLRINKKSELRNNIFLEYEVNKREGFAQINKGTINALTNSLVYLVLIFNTFQAL